MNRRDFLKTAGLGAASLALAPRGRAADSSPAEMSKARILNEADARIATHRRADATLTLLGPDAKPLPAGLTVRIEQKKHTFLFGCNIFKLHRCRTPDDNAAYEERFAALLNFATLPFYWWNYERRRGMPDDARTDEIVQWCKAHNVTTKGHPLAWNYVDPPWLGDDTQEAMRLQYARIERCVRRFAGDIDIWDVVNEATHYDRPEPRKRAPALTGAIDKMGIGPYVRGAFNAARKASPKAALVINDYRTDSAFADKVISQLVENDRPLYDVIGIQSHMHGGYWGAERAWRVCDYFARFGKPLHFTETTVVSGPRTDTGWLTTPDGEQRQAEAVAEFYRVLFSHPAVEAITWWDFTDQNAWQRAPAGLVRDDMTPKPAYDRLHELIKGKWWTRADATLRPGGKTAFTGFLGRYEAAVTLAGRRITGAFTLDKAPQDPLEVQLS
jgi:endo-1,4-beta-xylanase